MKHIIHGEFISMLETSDLYIKNLMNGMFGGNRRSKAYGISAEFADFREYTPGDDLRRIDWNLFARFEKLLMKLYVDERQLHHRVYIDTSASMDWGKPNKAHVSIQLAAAIGYLSVQAMDRVSFYTINNKRCENICRTVIGKDAFYNAIPILENIKFRGESDFARAINGNEDIGYGNGLSIIISDFLTDNDWKSGVDYLLYNKREVHLIQVLSRDEVAPGMYGKVFMLDSEGIGEDDSRNYKTNVTRSSLKAYAEAFMYHQNDIKNFCEARNIGFITVCSDENIEKMLFEKATEAGIIT